MGFNPNHRVEDVVHGIVEGIKYNRNHGNKKVVLLSADVKKAYPSMPRGKMLKAIADMGVTGQLYQATLLPRTTTIAVSCSRRTPT